MFGQLFKRPINLAKQLAGPLREDRLRYLSHLSGPALVAHEVVSLDDGKRGR